MHRRVLLFGAAGRIGGAIAGFVPDCIRVAGHVEDHDLNDLVLDFDVLVLAVPADAARALLDRAQQVERRGLILLDCSGVAKKLPHHIYNKAPVSQDALAVVGNPGCIAAAVIGGLRGLKLNKQSGLSIVANGGRSYAPEGQDGTMRTGRVWLQHPHVREIESALAMTVNSFVPIVSYTMEASGLLVVISGRLLEDVPSDETEAVDIRAVVGTERLVKRLEVRGDLRFTMVVCIDNVVHVAWLAATTIQQCLRVQNDAYLP